LIDDKAGDYHDESFPDLKGGSKTLPTLSRSSRTNRSDIFRLIRTKYELPIRVALVCVLMAGVLGLSHWVGPGATGVLAVYPVSTACTMLILHSRLGGWASAAVIANGLFTVASSAKVWGIPTSLVLGLLAVPGNPGSRHLRRAAEPK
jgi:hypothetical protein